MADIINSNLEPIDEKDLDLESKFGKAGPEKTFRGQEKETFKVEEEPKKEMIFAERDNAYKKILSKVQSRKIDYDDQHEIEEDAKKAFEKQDAESQVQHLVDVAMAKGIVYAVKVARHLEDNYVLDKFHDQLLAEELHNALKQKGLIEEI